MGGQCCTQQDKTPVLTKARARVESMKWRGPVPKKCQYSEMAWSIKYRHICHLRIFRIHFVGGSASLDRS